MNRIYDHFVIPGELSLRISAEDSGLTEVAFLQPAKNGFPETPYSPTASSFNNGARRHIHNAKQQLAEFFEGERRKFHLPVVYSGTSFQRRVWQALQEIPFGATLSYGEVAQKIGFPGAARAVGAACRRNPIALVIPCHRVIAKDGSLAGFGGGLSLKQKLLTFEQEPLLDSIFC